MSVTETENRYGQNEFGGDTHWDDAPLAEIDRGDGVDIEGSDAIPEQEYEAPEQDAEDTFAGEGDEHGEEQEGEVVGEEPGVEQPAPKKKDSNPMVPRQRLNKEIQKRQQLELRLRELEALSGQASTPAPFSPQQQAVNTTLDDNLVNQMFASVLDGDEGKAQAAFKQLLESHGQQLVQQMSGQSVEAAQSTYAYQQEVNSLQQAAGEVVAEYPEFDHTSDDADMGLVEEVLGLRDTFIANGMSAGEALRRSARLVAIENGIQSRKAASTPSRSEVGRKPVNVQQQMARAQQAPQRLQGNSGKNKDVRVDVTKLSDDQFASMSREALAKARGDFL
ncbi:hypothetical protein HNR62_000302 [Oceanisphaera litoralis]|uniref:hypothetical protein n=1 Tax=Oceanisphaera litoralis TaxID=225144 RepID=UPI001956677E|nr:hypothetical protein [Oceanisphaera litoralis]MBM7454473.1 hypothetical protein [Oceanisphaera litoralis]